MDPVVSAENNFTDLQIPLDHVSRSPKDTYYLSQNPSKEGNELLLRTHTSAHQTSLMKNSHQNFLMSGDVYRRDEIDCSHYPIFHQMEGVRIYSPNELQQVLNRADTENKVSDQECILADLKNDLESLATALFGTEIEIRWVDAYFPFTHPSLEMEILFNGEWLEVLGCGVIHPKVMQCGGQEGNRGYAFGLGLERLAMVLFSIPDIRLFWSQDTRFISQFRSGEVSKFQAYSKYPLCYKDVSFWINDDYDEKDMFQLIRDVAQDLVEQVTLVDSFVHPKTNKTSQCYRINYRSMDRSLRNEEIDELQFTIRHKLQHDLGLELR